MSTVLTHREALRTLIAAVPEVGVVHAFEPYAKTQTEFQAAYLWTVPGGGQQLRGWHIRRTATRERELGVGRTLNAHTWRVRGFMALDLGGATELEFDDLVEAIRRAYRLNPTLGGAAQLSPADGAGIDVTASVPVFFAGVLCHSATLQLTTHAYLDSGE